MEKVFELSLMNFTFLSDQKQKASHTDSVKGSWPFTDFDGQATLIRAISKLSNNFYRTI